MYTGAFKPTGNSLFMNLTSSPTAAVQLSTNAMPSMRVLCSSNSMWFAVSNSSSVTLAIPTTSTPANGIGLASAGKAHVECFNIGPNAWVSFGTTGGTAKGFVTPGIGR